MVAKLETFYDNFNDNSIDTNRWVNNGGGQIVETNKELEITTTTSHPTYYYIDSLNQYDLTGSYFFIKLEITNTTLVNVATDIAVYANTNNGLIFSVDTDTLYAVKIVATVKSTVHSAAYNSTNHKWLRIRESVGTTYWDTSPDGTTWTNFTSLANPITVTSVFVEFAAGAYGATTGTTIAKIDNLNILNPKTETLIDNFNDNSIDTNKWNNYGGAQVAEINQELELTTTTAHNYWGMNSVNQYDLTGSYVLIKLVDPGNTSLLTHDCAFQCYITPDVNAIQFQVYSNQLVASKWASNIYTGMVYVTYNPSLHKWLRMRESGGTAYWDYSVDGQTWTNLWSESNPITLTSLHIAIYVGNGSIEASGTTSKVDNLNIIFTPLQWFGA